MTPSITHCKRPYPARFLVPVFLFSFSSLIFSLFTPALFAFQPASIPWETFLKRSDLVVWVTLVKWERTKGGGNRYTFRINKIYRGPALKKLELTIPLSPGESIGPVGLAADGFLFLRKQGTGWKTSAGGRSWWPHLYAMQPGYNSVIHTVIGMPLHGLPQNLLRLKKRFALIKILVDQREHPFKADLYLRDEVDAFLQKALHGSL